MALTRRVAATSVPRQKGSPEGEPVAVDPHDPAIGAVPLLDRVPTQRGAHPEAPEPQPAPSPVPQPQRRAGRRSRVVVALAVSGALVASSVVVAHQHAVQVEARNAADVRVAADRAVQDADTAARQAAQQSSAAAFSAALVAARAAARDAATAGTQQLAADVHADPALLAALQAAIGVATGTVADDTASLGQLSGAAAGVTSAAKAASDAEAAWQVADQARVAAAQQAAAAAAAAQAAPARPAVTRPTAPRPATTIQRTTSSSTAPAPTGGRVQAIPAGGLVCPGAPVGAGVSELSFSAIGAAINAWRQGQGLRPLGIGRSSVLVAHAEDMAASGGIWHSGYDNIVGCTTGSVSTLVQAWANSAPHRAQMMRTDVSTMNIGGATSGGWLYGAVKFS